MLTMTRGNDDLWASALDKLSEVDRQQLEFDGCNNLDVLSGLQALTERAREDCIMKRWRLPRRSGNGETIVLRDLFSKIVVWVNIFKQVGDNMIQFDPVHAALPW